MGLAFTRTTLSQHGISYGPVSVCLSVSLSQAVYCIETARRIELILA